MPHAASNEPRFRQLTMDQLNEQQRPLGEQIMKVSRVGLGGPYNPMLRSPVFAQKMFDLLYYLRWQTSVPLKLNEFAILIVGRQWRSQIEWFAHEPLALKAGLSPDIVADLKKNRRPANMPPEEAVVYDFITELTRTPRCDCIEAQTEHTVEIQNQAMTLLWIDLASTGNLTCET